MDEVAARADRGAAKGGLTERPRSVCPVDGFTSANAQTVSGREYHGAVTEQFVALELRRRAHRTPPTLHERDDKGGLEVDIIAEIPDGQLVAIEVESWQSVTNQSWSAIERFRTTHKDRKITGVFPVFVDSD